MISVAFLGERGSFSELAAREFFGTSIQCVSSEDFDSVFYHVMSGECNYGIIPIENSMAGSIHQNFDLLLEHECVIVGEIYIHIEHFLIANQGVAKRAIKKILSHPQPLSQCRSFITKMTNIETIATSSTSEAVRLVKTGNLKDAAAIGSMQSALDYNMKVLAKNVEDSEYNLTRFLIVAKNSITKKQTNKSEKTIKTSIVFCTKNIPGVLFKALSAFSLRDINLSKIESRPLRGKHFEYIFYLDFQGCTKDPVVQKALLHLQEITTFYRLLGSYSVGEIVRPAFQKRA